MNQIARVIGVDIGGTKVAVASMTDTAEIGQRLVRPTPRTGGADVLSLVAELIARIAKDVPVLAVGVGVPGVIGLHDGSVVSATETLPGWSGTPVRSELERLTGFRVAVANDVTVMARGELTFGAGRDADDVLFVSVGTGVGGAIARNGLITHGPHGTAGELAHLLVPITGPLSCGCGRFDHLESVACGPAIAAAYEASTGRGDMALPDVVRLMRAGDPVARKAVIEAAQILGRTLGGLLSAIDVERVVVGGGVAEIGNDFLDPLTASLHAEVLTPLHAIPIRTAELGTDAPLIGAGLLATDLLPLQAWATR